MLMKMKMKMIMINMKMKMKTKLKTKMKMKMIMMNMKIVKLTRRSVSIHVRSHVSSAIPCVSRVSGAILAIIPLAGSGPGI